MFDAFDSSGRQPRPGQKMALSWLSQNWFAADVLSVVSPTGFGKTAIARALQIEFGQAVVLNAENALVRQALETYTDVGMLVGKTHYPCISETAQLGANCGTHKTPCDGCPYQAARVQALSGASNFTNTHAYAALRRHPDFVMPRVVVIDEAHRVLEAMRSFGAISLSRTTWDWPDEAAVDELVFVRWLKGKIKDMEAELAFQPRELQTAKRRRLQAARRIYYLFRSDVAAYALAKRIDNYGGKRREYLDVKPVRLPAAATKWFFGDAKIILLSATLMPEDVRELAGDRSSLICDLPSPIPADRRPIYYEPVSYRMNYQTDPTQIAQSIEAVIRRYGPETPNTIVHLTFDMARRVSAHMTMPHLVNAKEDKAEILAKFKERGGVFLAAGFAEGVDLKHDLARLNIIPKLLIPSFNDLVIKKRISLEGGQRWLNEQVLKTTVQQAGRTTRSEDDYSETYILDPNFERFYRAAESSLPEFFKQAIHWQGRPK